jgi:WD40 repeat protein
MKEMASFGFSSNLERKNSENVSAKSLAFLQGGSLFATSGKNGIQFWDMESENRLTYEKVDGADNIGSMLSLVNDNVLFFTEEGGKHIMVWDVATQHLMAKLFGNNIGKLVALSREGSFLISNGGDRTIRVWERVITDGFDALTHDSEVISTSLSQDGRKLFSALKNGNVVIWDLSNEKKMAVIEDPSSNIQNDYVSLSPDQQVVASLKEETIRIWDFKTGKHLFDINLANEFKTEFVNVFRLSFLLNGKVLACWGYDGDIKGMFPKVVLWDTDGGKRVAAIGSKDDPVLSMAVSPDGKSLALGGVDGEIKLLDAVSLKEQKTMDGPSGSVFTVTFSQDGLKIASKTRKGKGENIIITIWNLGAGRNKTIPVEPDHMGDISFSPDGRFLVSTDKKRVFLWDTNTGVKKAAIEKPEHISLGFDSLLFTPDGKTLIINNITFFDSNVYLLDLSSILKSPSEILRDAEEYTGLRIDGFKILSGESSE